MAESTLIEIEDLPVDALSANDRNPNEMDERSFNGLCESITTEGWVQPCASVVELPDGRYEIVGGHHRWEAAKVLGHELVPCVILDSEKFDQDRRDWNLVKQNVLHGALNPVKFSQLFADLAKKYDADVMKSLMGFTDEDAFQKLYKEVKRALPPGMQEAMEAAKDEIRTVDDLSLVLNRLFAEYGETLPSNMMAFSWGGREVLWVRCDDEVWDAVSKIAKQTAAEGKDFAALVAHALLSQVLVA